MRSFGKLNVGFMARGSALSLVAKIFAVGLGFLYAVIAARLLGVSRYGELSVAMSAASVAAILGTCGIDALAVREVARLRISGEWGKLRTFVLWSMAATAVASFMAATLLAILSFGRGVFADELLIAAITVPLLALLYTLRGIMQGWGKVVAAQLPLDVIRWSIVLVLIAIMIATASNPSTHLILTVIILSLFAALLSASLLLFATFRREIPYAEPAATARGWLPAAAAFLGIALFGVVGSEINTLLLGWLAGPTQAGLYQPIARIAPLMMLGTEAIAMPLGPLLAGLWHKGERKNLAHLLRRSAVASTIVTGVICTTILILSPWILSAFGNEFAENAYLLTWIAGAQMINAATGASPSLLSMAGQMRQRISVQLATFAFQAGLGTALVGLYGATGAAAALAAAIVVWSILHWLVALRTTGLDSSLIGLKPLVVREETQT